MCVLFVFKKYLKKNYNAILIVKKQYALLQMIVFPPNLSNINIHILLTREAKEKVNKMELKYNLYFII